MLSGAPVSYQPPKQLILLRGNPGLMSMILFCSTFPMSLEGYSYTKNNGYLGYLIYKAIQRHFNCALIDYVLSSEE